MIVDELLRRHATGIGCHASGTELGVKPVLFLRGEQALDVENIATLVPVRFSFLPMTNNTR